MENTVWETPPHITTCRPGFYAIHWEYDEEEVDETIFHGHVVEAWGTVDIVHEEEGAKNEKDYIITPLVFVAGRYARLMSFDSSDESLVGIFFSRIVFENTRGTPVVSDDELRKDPILFTAIIDEWEESHGEGNIDGEEEGIHGAAGSSNVLNTSLLDVTCLSVNENEDEEDEEI